MVAEYDWVKSIQANSGAKIRLGEILGHTASSEDGETIYVPTADLAEVYAIMYMAYTAGPEDVRQLVDSQQNCGDRCIGGTQLVKAVIETDEGIEFAALPEADAWVEVDIWH
ncbi:MAG: hypothetical protein ACM3ZA_10310 [Bacillota bacterium]